MLIPVRDHNPSGKRAYVTYALLAANILIFISYYGLFANEAALMRLFMGWGMVPAVLSSGTGYDTLLTHQFLHGGIMHLAFNMLFLWIYGDNMEEAWGHLPFSDLLLGLRCCGRADPIHVRTEFLCPHGRRLGGDCRCSGRILVVLSAGANRHVPVSARLFPHYSNPGLAGSGRLVRDAGFLPGLVPAHPMTGLPIGRISAVSSRALSLRSRYGCDAADGICGCKITGIRRTRRRNIHL